MYHSRLAIVATADASARQPIVAAGHALVCNGFISNAPDVYRALGVTPVPGDCRAMLEAYVARGPAGLAMLRGQFAGAIVDPSRSELVLARDSSGIAPMYYVETPGGLLFGSQASFLMAALRDIDPAFCSELALAADGLDSWSAMGYTVGPDTLITPIKEVAAGTVCVFSLDGRLIRTTDWAHSAVPRATNAHAVATAFHAAVGRNLAGDHMPWVLLSGGLDSLLLLHSAVVHGVRPTALTLRYPDGSNADEVAMAQQIARHYGVHHMIQPFMADAIAPQPERFRGRVDWPVDGGSLVPKSHMADIIHRVGGRVVLGGTGADEMFGGYTRHQARLRMLAGRDVATTAEEHLYYHSQISKFGRHPGAWKRFQDACGRRSFADPAFVYDLLEVSQYHSLRVDSCFANVGIEYRPVFLDGDVLAIAAALPLSEKSSPGRPKSMLREAFAGEIRSDFLAVPKKPLRFGRMGPNPEWRRLVFDAWLQSRPINLYQHPRSGDHDGDTRVRERRGTVGIAHAAVH